MGDNRFVITEFINDVPWDRDPYSSINLAAGHFAHEGRWLKDKRYVQGFIDYMFAGGGDNPQYTDKMADGAYSSYLVNADSAFITGQLNIMKKIYEQWDDHFDKEKNLYFMDPLHDGTEYNISSIDASGGIKGKFGGEPTTTDGVAVYEKSAQDAFFGGEAFRASINCAMYGNALAIAKIAALSGNATLSGAYLKRASDIKSNLQNSLWNESFSHFTDRYHVTNQYVKNWDFVRGRELEGFVPWQYNLPDNTAKYNNAWKNLMDPTKFLGKHGLRTVEPSYPYYMKYFKLRGGRPDCQWNGASWPFQTAQVLTAMANLLDNYTQDIIKTTDYLMFYIGYSDVNHPQIGMARSKDGISGWERFAGNPIVQPGTGSAWDSYAVYKPIADTANNRWLLYYNGRKGWNEQIGVAVHKGMNIGF